MSAYPHVIPDMSNRAYHAHAALGSTSLKTLATRTPAHWRWECDHPVRKDAYDIGTVTHSLILEGDESGVQVIDVPDKLGNKWKIPAAEARDAGLIPVTGKEMDGIRGMRDSVMANPIARAALTGHLAEQSVFWEEEDLALKCRPDAWKGGKLWDLKTILNADPREFGKTAHNYGYHQSHAHYVDGVAALTGETLPFGFILVEKTAPYLVSVVELDWEAVELGRALNDRAKRIYRECSDNSSWPGYPTAEPISLPTFAVYATEDLLGIDNNLELKL